MRKLPEGITEPMWWSMCDYHMDTPVPLSDADVSRPFVYERRWGVFYVPMGMHQAAMSLLLAFQHDLTKCYHVCEKLNLKDHEEAADLWLEKTPGAAFRSSVGKKITVANTKDMTILERRRFGDVSIAFPSNESKGA